MFDKYYRKNKRKIFPWVKDWTSPHDEIRYSNNIKDMDFNKWFFFHPSAYKIVFYGFNCVGVSNFSLFALIFYIKNILFGSFICLLFAGYFIYNLIIKSKQRKTIKDFTMYDLYMREFPKNNN